MLNGCKTGDAKITKGYKLPARFVIHTVGPVYQDGHHGESDLLYSCYYKSLTLAAQYGVKTIAFPCISTGIYGYPFDDACKIALQAVRDFLKQDDSIIEIILCCYSTVDYKRYSELATQA
jgi:O-acetyl-ADP-ribose deacetylase (regulator of RNase III)